MTEKDFAKMTKEELKKYREELCEELNKVNWYLRNRFHESEDSNK